MEFTLNKDECVTTIKLINRCLAINSISDLHKYYEDIKVKLDIDQLIVIYFVNDFNHPEILSFGTDPQWQKIYSNENYLAADPIIPISLNSQAPIIWSDVYKKATETCKHFINGASSCDFKEGLSYGVIKHPITSRSIVVSVGIQARQLKDKQKVTIKEILPHLADVCVRQSLWARPMFTPKEKEITQWCAKGKSYGEIALILQISERTVKFHMKNICEKLGAYNKPQAVAKSLNLGLI
ncbi:LuxR C-terminal-related transcriptional regulator [Pseudomonas sp. HK3]